MAAAIAGSPPPTSVLVALHSGIVEVGADGTATSISPCPTSTAPSGSWPWPGPTTAVGHAVKDVVVHDPVVVTLSPPRFLRVGDTSRLLVEIANISGPAGAYAVELTHRGRLSTSDIDNQTADLIAGGRASLEFPLTGTAIGDHDLTLLVTDPNGNALVKTLTLGVRATSGRDHSVSAAARAGRKHLTLDDDRFSGSCPVPAS